ncbi:hypothetical protein ABZ907_28990 [Nonomuraea wenchangensis]
MISVSLIIDNPDLQVIAIASLAADPGCRLLARAGSLPELTERQGDRADVIVVDAALAGPPDGAETLRLLRAAGHRAFALGEDATLVEAPAQSALAPGRLAPAIRTLLGVGPQLSGQERAVLLGYASGLTLETAARRAGIQPSTAKKYLERIKRKYADCGRSAYTKVDLARCAREDGLLG